MDTEQLSKIVHVNVDDSLEKKGRKFIKERKLIFRKSGPIKRVQFTVTFDKINKEKIVSVFVFPYCRKLYICYSKYHSLVTFSNYSKQGDVTSCS